MKRSIENFEQWNEEMIAKYNPDKYHNSTNVIIRGIEFLRTRAVIKLLNVNYNDMVLDLGCGAGNMLEKMLEGNFWGVDISKTLLSAAKKRLNGRKLSLIYGNVESLPEKIKALKFDKVFCSEVLEHVLNPEKVIDEILSVTKPDGRVVISIPNEDFINFLKSILIKLGLFGLLFPGISKKMDNEWHLHEMDLKSIKDLVSGKLKIITTKRIPFHFLPIRYVILCEIPKNERTYNKF